MPLVSRLSTTPVKGTALHHPRTVTVTDNGVLENRRFHLVDAQYRLYNGKQHGPLVRLTAEFDADSAHLRLRFPDRPSVEGRAADLGEAVCTDFYGRDVDEHLVEGPWSAALSDFVGEEVHLVAVDRPGDAVDVHPVTLMSSATIEHLRRVTPDGGTLTTAGSGCWSRWTAATCTRRTPGRPARADRRGHLHVVGPVPRCVVTNENPDSGVVDVNTLRRSCGTAASSPPT